MAFVNVKIIDPYVEKGWTPELKLTLADIDEIHSVEAKLNVSFPDGYREYVTTLGLGEYIYNAVIRIDMPSAILLDHREYQESLEEYWFWEEGGDVLSKERAVECIRISDTVGGDTIIFHPSNSKKLFLLPHDEEIIYKIGSNLYEAIDWVCVEWDLVVGNAEKLPEQRYFVPNNPFQSTHGIIYPENI
jgi:hypothetical protein